MVGKAGMFSNGSFDKKRMFDLTLKFLACRHALQKNTLIKDVIVYDHAQSCFSVLDFEE